MKSLVRNSVVGLALGVLAIPSIASAFEYPGSFSGNAGLFSDYTFRGISQTGEDAALQGGIDWSEETTGLWFGIWGSSVNFGDGTYLEQDIYGGWAGEVGGLSVDVGAYFFWYPKQESALNYWEFAANLGYEVDGVGLGFNLMYSPDYFGSLGNGWYFSPSISYALPLGEDAPIGIGFDAAIGYTIADDPIITDDDYVDWQVGMTISPTGNWEGLGIDLRYVDTDINNVIDEADARFVYGVSYSF